MVHVPTGRNPVRQLFHRRLLAPLLPLTLVAVLVTGSNLAFLPAHAAPLRLPTEVSGPNHVHSIAIMPRDPNALYLGGHYRLLHSLDRGMKWNGLVNEMMLSLAIDPAHPSTLYSFSSQNGLQKSTDGGKRWRSIQAGLPAHAVVGVRLDAVNGSVLAYGTGIYRSTDGGKRWSTVLKGASVYDVAAGGSTSAFAATDNGLYASRDGAHWTAVPSMSGQPVIQVVAGGQTAYAVSPLGLLTTVNGGKSWHMLPRAPAGIEFLGIAPSKPSEVFGEVARKGFYVSRDGGKSWKPANTGITDRNFSASTIQVAPSDPNVVYTGSWGLHFYASRDGGRSWKLMASLAH